MNLVMILRLISSGLTLTLVSFYSYSPALAGFWENIIEIRKEDLQNAPVESEELLQNEENQTENHQEEGISQESASDENNPVSPPPATQLSEEENPLYIPPLPQGEGTTLREEEEIPEERQRNSYAKDNPLLESGRGEGEVLHDEVQSQFQQEMFRQREAEVNTLQEDNESTPSSPTPEQVSEDEGEGTILHDSQPAR